MNSNPNGANQYQMDPRQKLCWESYIDPRSETFGNGYQSAIKAGYEDLYAKTITTIDWFSDKVRRMNMLQKAEKVLEKTLSYETEEEFEGKVRVKTDLLKIQQDTAKFVAERLGKNTGYSSRTEQTGADGKDLPTPIYGGAATKTESKLNNDAGNNSEV